ncbi:MAG: hypothetical protein JWM53_6026 [bacterium]|nr:hypothetical protein [bacterium]
MAWDRDLPDEPHCEALDGAVQVTSGPGTATIRRTVQTHAAHWGPGEIDDMLGVVRKMRQAAFAVTAPP